MYRPVDVIAVNAWGRRVGAVTLDPKLGYYAFEYTPAWRRTGIELSPLHLPLSEQTYIFPLLADVLAVGDRFMVPSAKLVVEEVSKAVARWPEFAKRAGLPPAEIERIRQNQLSTFDGARS